MYISKCRAYKNQVDAVYGSKQSSQMVGEFISYQDYYMEIDKQLVEIVDKNKFFKPEFDLRKAFR